MRICLYTATALPKLGGQEAVVDSLARHFTRLGHRAVVLAPRPRLPLLPQDHDLPYPVVRHPRFYSTRHFVSLYRRFLLPLHAKENFDVVHCHDVYPTGYLAALCRERMAIPLVITSHGGDVKEGNIRISKAGMEARYIRAVESADALVSIGNFTTEGFRRLHGSDKQIVPIPNGIDPEPFAAPAGRPVDLDAKVRAGQFILFLGRLKSRKGVDVLLDAITHLPAKIGVHFVIAGTGEEESELKSLARELNVDRRVHFVGRVEGEGKMWLLQNALCVTMPSRDWEAFPLVLLESFAAGKAVIGSRIPGIEDLLEDNVTGRLTPEGSPEALADAFAELISNPDRAREMGERAKAFARNYSWDAVAARHIALYDTLACGRPRQS
ncbi:MAG TPA: glycosyltransferase family 4 protein [Tepidisphaeraceae bacterium]|jgi:glycosyltransferase involved in cell wall biosynthesis|nr:glycosyltransferase family 4 protein [Tepidisphaeraceae bacterium]